MDLNNRILFFNEHAVNKVTLKPILKTPARHITDDQAVRILNNSKENLNLNGSLFNKYDICEIFQNRFYMQVFSLNVV